MNQTTKKKRTLSNINFSGDNSHIALVSEAQGGPANGAAYALVLKTRSAEFVTKASKIQVELTIEEYLERFYNIWGSDAIVLAKIFGMDVDSEGDSYNYEEWIDERVKSVKILKALKESPNVAGYLASLDEDSVLTLLQDQETFEKSIKEFESSANRVDNSAKTKVEKVEPTGSKTIKKEKNVDKEMIEKSALVAIEKELADNKAELLKAREMLQEIEKAKAVALIKARTDVLGAVLKDGKNVEVVMKAAGAVDAENFDALVAVFKSQAELLEKSGMFAELGKTVEVEDAPPENHLQKLIKQKYHKEAK